MRRDGVATVAWANEAEWVSQLRISSGTPCEPAGPHDYALDSGVKVFVEDLKSIRPIKVSGINGGVAATQSGTRRLLKECLYAPDCRLSLVSYPKLMKRYRDASISAIEFKCCQKVEI